VIRVLANDPVMTWTSILSGLVWALFKISGLLQVLFKISVHVF
jgi:hypothetical protein